MLNAWSLIQLCSEMDIWESDWVIRALPFIGRWPHWPLIIEWTTGKWWCVWRLWEAGPGWRKWVPEGMPWGLYCILQHHPLGIPAVRSEQLSSATHFYHDVLPRSDAKQWNQLNMDWTLILWARINLSIFKLFLSDICHSEEKLTNTVCYHSPLTTMFVPTPLAPNPTGEPQPLLCSNEWKLKPGIKSIQWPPSEWLGNISRCYKAMVV